MKSATFNRSTIAAAMAFAAAGALFAAKPAAAQQAYVVVPAPAVVAQSQDRWDNDRWDNDRWDHGDRNYGRWDRQAPVITDVTPDRGQAVTDRGATHIAARFHDSRTGVAAVSLRVDGRDVTRRARIDSDEIRYRENLAPGRHYAQLSVRDRAGNVTNRSWSFDVVDTGRVYGYSRW